MSIKIFKLDGLSHKELTNIDKVVKEIPKEKYENIRNLLIEGKH